MLRQSTRPMHDRLEKRLDILRSPFDPMRWLRILQRFYGFYQPVEQQIPAYQNCTDRWFETDRRKLPLLLEDLRRASLTDLEINLLPICSDIPDLVGLGEQLGCMYVLEGATLGGQVVLRHLDLVKRPGTPGLSFFSSYGHLVGQRWREFCERLEFLAESSHCCETIVASACETFAALDRWLAADGGV